jgi:hypothetical protein
MKPFLAAVLCVSTLLPLARADHWDDDRRGDDRRRGPARVILFDDAGYRGAALELFPGDAIDNFSGKTFDGGAKLNDSVSSIRIEGDVEVYVYENSRFRGEALRLTESVRDLTGRLVARSVNVSWNDRISSIKVVRARGRDDDRDHRPDNRPGDRPRGDVEKIIKSTFTDLLGREPDPGELRDFRARFLDAGWNERMLRDHLRSEERYRIEAADRLVHRAYLDVLGRAPDESGLKQYRWAILRKNWTEGDVRDDLRKSDEFRSKHR